MTTKKTKDAVTDLGKKYGGKTLSGATVLFLFGLVFNNVDKLDTKIDVMAEKMNDNQIALIREIQTVRQEATDEKMNYFGIINDLFADIREMKERQ